jgi:hypothetical protein
MADTAPASPTPGTMWFDTTGTQLYVWYNDGTSSQWIAAAAAGGSGRTAARMQLAWDTGAVVTNDTVYFVYDAPYAGVVNSMTYFTGAGSFTVAVQIAGAPVTGLGAVAVSSATAATATATAANTFAAGQRIAAVVTAATGSPTDALLSLNVTWS